MPDQHHFIDLLNFFLEERRALKIHLLTVLLNCNVEEFVIWFRKFYSREEIRRNSLEEHPIAFNYD